MATQISNGLGALGVGQYADVKDAVYRVSNVFSCRIQKSQNDRFVVYVGPEGTIPNVYSYNSLEEMRDGLIGLMTKEILECS